MSADAAVYDDELASRIAGGAAVLSIPLDRAQVESLVAYLRLVERWNATYNLTSVRDPRAMVTQHVLDSLAAAAALCRRRAPGRRRRTLDVGSGAGLPGVVFAVAMPETEVVCIDSVGKKAAFITQAAAAIGARNATALHGRVERLREPRFDVITSRAFASLAAFVASTRHLLAENGEWLAMKGKAPAAEVAALAGVTVEIEPLAVPELDAERCAVWIKSSE